MAEKSGVGIRYDVPLILDSLGNYIGITESAKEMYGKIMSIGDELMLRYYELLSHISIEEFNALKEGIQTGKIHPKRAKEGLALEIVERYWGKDKALKAKEEFERVFKDKGMPDEIPSKFIKIDDTVRMQEDVKIEITTPSLSVPAPSKGNTWLPQVMKSTGLTNSTSEAIRLIKQGGVKLNDTTVTDPNTILSWGEYVIKVGKRRFYKVIVE